MKRNITARQRIEQAVEKVYVSQHYAEFSPYEVTELILAERERMRREVRKVAANCSNPCTCSCDNILTRLRG